MTSYFQYNDNKTKRPPARTEHGTEIVDIPGIMVTESEATSSEQLPAPGRSQYTGYDNPAYDRHGWRCPCIKCRIDRGED